MQESLWELIELPCTDYKFNSDVALVEVTGSLTLWLDTFQTGQCWTVGHFLSLGIKDLNLLFVCFLFVCFCLLNIIFQTIYSDLYKWEVLQIKINVKNVSIGNRLNQVRWIDHVKGTKKSITNHAAISPGIDGFPNEIDVAFWEHLDHFLLAVIIFSVWKGEFLRDVNTALISLLLKNDEDPADCSSYRSLSFDRSECSYLWSVLEGFGIVFIEMIKTKIPQYRNLLVKLTLQVTIPIVQHFK